MTDRKVFAWYDGTTMLVELGTTSEPLTDELTGVAVTSATVTLRVMTAAGVDVAGPTWPLALPHVGGGVYRAAVPILTLSAQERYIARIRAVVGAVERQWDVDVISVPARAT